MRYLRMKKAMAWDMLGWFLFVLIVLVVIIMIMAQVNSGSFNIIDMIFNT